MRKKHAGDTISIDGADAFKSLKGDIHTPDQSDLGLTGSLCDVPYGSAYPDVTPVCAA